ncbi:MAG TPA: enoyl-CoA hydratase [Acidimicrobiaceae bacterium]|nr:enoyl-CoA hydratase [Acidimicrobiaceae bacterium]HCV34490.1 enoyl-CoA hydratase [Acidimicrobiaceae bacterium]|tara:strand:+ start:78 stop:839 length:762 start_codon:yes stop_codon:yes gene_type:complete
MAVQFEVLGRQAVITLDRPTVRNAINRQMALDIEAAVDRLEADDDIWVGLLCAKGPTFCAGADLKEVASGKPDFSTTRGGFAGLVRRERVKPLIAVVEGAALAGGCEIVLSCDLVVAGAEALFGLPEVKRSLVANAGGLLRLPKVLPRNIAMEMILTGDPIDAKTAHKHGLVNCLTPAGGALDEAQHLASRIEANAPLAVRASRRVALNGPPLQEDEGFALSEEASRDVFRSKDFEEGPRAFIEKRSPRWQGK